MASTIAPAAKVLAACLILACIQNVEVNASAIPIWELLTRNEKMSYLYSTFAELVSGHCKAAVASTKLPVNECKRNLLTYGYSRLQAFSDYELDAIDPYQRDAGALIWQAIMNGGASSTSNPVPTPPASSIIILTPQRASSKSQSSTHEPAFVPNPIFSNASFDKQLLYAMNMERHSGVEPQSRPYLNGPLVFRVRPDGTPVAEDGLRPLPRDDDHDAFHQSSSSSTPAPSRQNKHRKIASISALKQQHLATIALEQQLKPPYKQTRYRRFQMMPAIPMPVHHAQ